MNFFDKVTEERDCSQLVKSLYELDKHWDEFMSFRRTENQNLDHIRFVKDGKPMDGYFKHQTVLASHIMAGLWMETRQRSL